MQIICKVEITQLKKNLVAGFRPFICFIHVHKIQKILKVHHYSTLILKDYCFKTSYIFISYI